jgi:hypothetical protein
LARNNFSFEKRQKELDRKKKKEEKQRRKQEKSITSPEEDTDLIHDGIPPELEK